MTETIEKKVGTIAGPFDRARAKSLRETIEQSETPVTMWEGQELDVKFGAYLLEYVEQQLGMRGHNGL
jgi:hypothetical protein